MIFEILLYIIVLVVLVVAILIVISNLNFTKKEYAKLVAERLEKNKSEIALIKEDDLSHLPHQMRNFLSYVGVVGKEKVQSYTVYMTGKFRMSVGQKFQNIVVHQTSYQPDLTRLFYMEMSMFGAKITGLHKFVDESAVMEVKLLDIFKVVDEKGDNMNKAETVTVFNDMCLLAPQTLIDPTIKWKEINEYTVEASFSRREHTIKAKLYFNEKYQLVNFVSQDRYAIANGKVENIQWSTPITEYHSVEGMNLPYKGSAIWNRYEGDVEYIKLVIENVEYNKHILKV